MKRKEQPKIYTEYDAQRRAEQIAGKRLSECIIKFEELEHDALLLIKQNSKLQRELHKAREAEKQRTAALIYYDETYNRLSKEDKAKFDSIAKGVVKEYDLPFNAG